MEYIYAALLLHHAGKGVSEDGIKAVLTAAGVAVDQTRVKALMAALEGVDIEESISKAAMAPVAAAAPAAAPAAAAAAPKAEAAEKKEEKKEQEEESGMAGLGALFG